MALLVRFERLLGHYAHGAFTELPPRRDAAAVVSAALSQERDKDLLFEGVSITRCEGGVTVSSLAHPAGRSLQSADQFRDLRQNPFQRAQRSAVLGRGCRRDFARLGSADVERST